MMPLHPTQFVSYALAVFTGFAFGFVLERAGFGDARRLAAQFYLTDMRVLKVMFGAVVTAALGLALLRAVGLLDWSEVYVNPTFLGAQALGGAIFGVGFVVGGHCPGTAVVSCATGRLNGFVFLAGVMLGALGYAAAYPTLATLADAGGEVVTLDQTLGLSFETSALLVTLAALALFAVAEYVERWRAARLNAPPPDSGSWQLRRSLMLSALVLGGVVAGLGASNLANARHSTSAPSAPARIAPFELASALRAGAPDSVVWLQGKPRHALDGNMVMAIDGFSDDQLTGHATAGRRVILALADGVRAQRLGDALARANLDVAVLAGGLEAWDRAMDVEPEAPAAGASAERWDQYRRESALRAYFGGERTPRAAELKLPAAPQGVSQGPAKKREGC